MIADIKYSIFSNDLILSNKEQPQHRTHAYTIVCDCGTEIDYAHCSDEY